ncbi:MAG: helix-turn-helix transcriptional regulator [Candidatus Erginobacter occultus]|nr:helix-turn-helix transcriptional regulator [Candidatus Erginobacter occultus]
MKNFFGDNVRRIRKSRNLSQEDLAEKSGLHRTYVSGIERGVRNPTLAIICRIAAALGVKPEELFKESPE